MRSWLRSCCPAYRGCMLSLGAGKKNLKKKLERNDVPKEQRQNAGGSRSAKNKTLTSEGEKKKKTGEACDGPCPGIVQRTKQHLSSRCPKPLFFSSFVLSASCRSGKRRKNRRTSANSTEEQDDEEVSEEHSTGRSQQTHRSIQRSGRTTALARDNLGSCDIITFFFF